MTLQQLEYILAVNQFRHFAKAAEHCHVTQPTLSAMVQKLEEELDVKLFDRSIQPVCPTAIGEKVIKQAQIILKQTLRVKDIIREESDSLAGTFRLAVLPTIAPYLLPRFFSQLLDKNPDIDIRVIEMKTNEIELALKQGSIDAAILATHQSDSNLLETPLFYEEFLGYVSRNESLFKQDVIRTSDITGKRLWLLDEGHCFRDQLMKFCQMEEVKLNQMSYQLGSMETFMRMVESGQGITFIPELSSLHFSQAQQELVRPFAIPRPVRQVSLVTTKNFIRHRLLKLLQDEIQASVPQEMLALQVAQTVV